MTDDIKKNEEAGTTGRALAAAIAKWLLPSITVLFVVVGYVIVEAQQNLLGITLGGVPTTDYIIATAGFLRDVCTLLPDMVVSVSSYKKLDVSQLTLLVIILAVSLTVSLLGVRFFIKGKIRTCLLAALLVIFVAATFILFDAPLTCIEDAVVNSGSKEGGVPIETRLREKSLSQPAGLQTYIYGRAYRIWTSMVCSRTTMGSNKDLCIAGTTEPALRIKGEFVAHSLVSVLLLILSVQVLRRTTVIGVSIVAILAATYTLTWPYCYGKLVKSTNFEYGQILVKPTEKVASFKRLTEGLPIQAIIVAHDSQGYKVLRTYGDECRQIEFLEIANSEVIAVQEIYWQDVLAWRAVSLEPCPQLPEGGMVP